MVSLAAIVLAVIAACICLAFYIAASRSRRGTEQAAKMITANIERLEAMSDKLLGETLSILRANLSSQGDAGTAFNMKRTRIQPAFPDVALSSHDAALGARLTDLESRLNEMISQQRAIAQLLRSVHSTPAPPSAARQPGPSAAADNRPDKPVRELILKTLHDLTENDSVVLAAALIDRLEWTGIDATDTAWQLEQMQKEGIISLSNDLPLDSNTTIRLRARLGSDSLP